MDATKILMAAGKVKDIARELNSAGITLLLYYGENDEKWVKALEERVWKELIPATLNLLKEAHNAILQDK